MCITQTTMVTRPLVLVMDGCVKVAEDGCVNVPYPSLWFFCGECLLDRKSVV